MKQINPFLTCLLVAGIMALLFLGACTKPYHFYVKYDRPESSTPLIDQTVYLQIIDDRTNKLFLSENASKEFDRWDRSFALYHTEKKPKGDVETHQMVGLIEAVMQQRLETAGIAVLKEKKDETPVLTLNLKKIELMLKGRTWVSDIRYEAKLTQDNLKVGKEQVSAQAERTKVMGRSAGERLLGDILTDSINQLNLEKLFNNAGLTSTP